MTSTAQQPIHVLDCTFRDGGYYNQWCFEPDLVADYLQAITKSGVDHIELGFRFLPRNRFFGPFAYTTDRYLDALDIPSVPAIGVMIDAKEYVHANEAPDKLLPKVFRAAADSKVSLVRVAVNISEAKHARELFNCLKKLGYDTTVNLMQVGRKSPDLIAKTAEEISAWGTVDVVYFADSLGNMEPNSVKDTILSLKEGWDGPIGFHGHDNKGFALLNSLTALECGAQWLDGTVTGMGRGAGNTCTESLLVELNARKHERYKPRPLLSLILDHFAKMRKSYGWGANILYHLSAHHEIHPTYVQELLSSPEYDTKDIIAALHNLSEMSGTNAFSTKSLESVLQEYSGTQAVGTWSPEGIARSRKVLIIGSGPSVEKHRAAILQYIRDERPLVLGLNLCPLIPAEFIDYYIASHKVRFLTHGVSYGKLQKPLICPFFDMPEEVRGHLAKVTVLEYGMRVSDSGFSTRSGGCSLPVPLTIAYALAIASAAHAEKIQLVGFDGYEPVNKKQREMEALLETYHRWECARPLSSLTPTTYGHLEQGSIYSPVL